MGIWKKYYLLGLVLLLAAILRFWNLAGNPPGLTWDEAALGYNAYSLLQTGRDEYGNLLPLNLKSFGDWKPALYAYLDIPFVAAFGLNELAVRLPSAIFGILGVFGVFLLTQELFKKKGLAILAAFLLAISPWHLQFSRPAFEANVALTFNIFAVYIFLKALVNKKLLIISAFLFGLSLIIYQASKLFIPLVISGLMIIYWNRVKESKFALYSLLILFGFLLMIAFTFFSGQTGRLVAQNFFAYQRSVEQNELISKEYRLPSNGIRFNILHGQWWEYIRGLTERYLIYFSPKMLFVDGDYSQRHRVPDLGALYYFSVILIPLGIIYLIRLGSKESRVVLTWLILAPLPAVLSRDLISILRALNLVVPFAILEATGLWWLIGWLRGNRGNKGNWAVPAGRQGNLGVGFIIIIMFINFIIFIDRYFVHAPHEYSKYWLYGYREVVNEVVSLKDIYHKVVISDTYGQPYIYYLFYSKYPPDKFQKQASLEQRTVDVGTVRNIDNIEFRHIFWPGDRGEKNTLFAGSLEELPDKDILPFKEFNLVKDINFLNGEEAFRIVITR